MMLRTSLWTLLLTFSLLLLAGCGDEDEVENPEGVNEQEVITTVNLTFTPMGGGDTVTAQFRDADGDGGEAPTQSDPKLAAGTTYMLDIEILNELENPAEDITEEIKEEAEEHQVFFAGTAVGGLVTHTYSDLESDYPNGNSVGEDLPVGLSSTIVTTEAGNGTFTVTLKHQPPVNDAPVKTPTSTVNDGDTDFELNFNLTVE